MEVKLIYFFNVCMIWSVYLERRWIYLFIWRVGAFTYLFGVWKSINVDLSMFSDSLLISSLSFILPISLLIKERAAMFSVFFFIN